MEQVTVGEIRRWVDGCWLGDPADEVVPSGISTDSRKLKHGQAFLALRGPNFDGNQFVKQAFDHGACLAIVDVDGADSGGNYGPVLRVHNTLETFGSIAKQYRKRFNLPVIAITGSAGKTTTKEMLAAVLGRKLTVLKSPNSENNEIGVPRTLLQLSEEFDAVVIELAAKRVGDIRYLCEIAQPTIGVLLNIGKAHLEFFGNVEGVAKAKGELLDYIGDESSLALVNVDDCVVVKETKRTKGRLLGFGLDCESHYSGEGLVLDQEGCGHFSLHNIQIDLKIPGRHNVYNALAAAAVGDQCGIPPDEIGAALNEFKAFSMRSEILRKNGFFVINDCYNASPTSAEAALNLLGDMELGEGGKRIAVLGDMLELGDMSQALHGELGRNVFRVGVDILLTYGHFSRFVEGAARKAGMKCVQHFDDKGELAMHLSKVAQAGDAILVKASRDVAFEDIVERLLVLS